MLWRASTLRYPRFLVPNEHDTYESPEELFSRSEFQDEDQPIADESYEYSERDAIVALPSWCSAPSGSGCQRCLAVCPTHALLLTEDGPAINEELCTKCGMCAGVCDAFAWSRITLEDLVTRSCREAESEGSVCFTCNEHIFPGLAPRSNVVVLPCLAALPPEFWSVLLAKDVSVDIFLDRTYCSECSVASPLAPQLFDHALNQAQAWTGKTISYVDTIPERESILSLYANIDEANRRELLATLAYEGRDIATGKHRQRNAATVDSFHENQERLRAQGRIRADQQYKTLPAALMQTRQWPRQKLIVEAAQALPERAELLERYQSVTNTSLCSQNHTCVNTCPTGARTLDEEGYPIVDAKRCIACGLCVAHCTQDACDFIAITAHEYCERTPHDENS